LRLGCALDRGVPGCLPGDLPPRLRPLPAVRRRACLELRRLPDLERHSPCGGQQEGGLHPRPQAQGRRARPPVPLASSRHRQAWRRQGAVTVAPEPQAPSEEAEVARSRVVCNPVDLSYRYQDVRFSGTVRGVRISDPRRSVHREAADPSVVRFKGRFFLFASMSRGFWHSEDLVTWEYRPSDSLPAYDYAPDVREIDGALYVCASRKDDPCPFYRSADPLTEDFTEVSPGTFPFWDPNLFQDEDGSVYLYWGCDNATPIKGVALERHSLEPLGEEVGLIGSDVERRGWEQVGEDHVRTPPATEAEELAAQCLGSDPSIEGAWMPRHGDRYYLQYAAPGTEYNTYADGYATADSPLGPFTYSAHSPFSAKYGGFITGAGHGSTFRDEYGKWWHAVHMRVSVHTLHDSC